MELCEGFSHESVTYMESGEYPGLGTNACASRAKTVGGLDLISLSCLPKKFTLMSSAKSLLWEKFAGM